MKAEHTPGPWVANDCIVKAVDCYGPWVADTDLMLRYPPRKPHISHAEQRANARLIAAAPDLLAALEELTLWARENTGPKDPNSPHHLLIVAVEAIRKAKEGQ